MSCAVAETVPLHAPLSKIPPTRVWSSGHVRSPRATLEDASSLLVPFLRLGRFESCANFVHQEWDVTPPTVTPAKRSLPASDVCAKYSLCARVFRADTLVSSDHESTFAKRQCYSIGRGHGTEAILHMQGRSRSAYHTEGRPDQRQSILRVFQGSDREVLIFRGKSTSLKGWLQLG